VTGDLDLADLADLTGVYQDLHAYPEPAFAEHRTAAIVAARLRGLGYQTTTGVGRTGVVGVLANGAGPTVLLRADMDGLPVLEQTGLAYASTAVTTGSAGHEVPLMHACGHDAHVTCLLGAAAALAADAGSWSGTLLLVFQPAEETGEGARAMIDDGLFDRFGLPDVLLGQQDRPRVRRRRLASHRAARPGRPRLAPGNLGGPGADGRRDRAATAGHRLP
jgi:metal-dependent amidase/aminoacylase/carboxypeptidase family protein